MHLLAPTNSERFVAFEDKLWIRLGDDRNDTFCPGDDLNGSKNIISLGNVTHFFGGIHTDSDMLLSSVSSRKRKLFR